jgi:acid phosphatase
MSRQTAHLARIFPNDDGRVRLAIAMPPDEGRTVRQRGVLRTALAVVLLVSGCTSGADSSGGRQGPRTPGDRTVAGPYHHLVVIYQENHSFDNLYGEWGDVGDDQVDGLRGVRSTQVTQDGAPYRCLPQDDVNLSGDVSQGGGGGITGGTCRFPNRPFRIDGHIHAADRTCPPPGEDPENGVRKDSAGSEPGGCTRDLVHRFYQHQYQIHGGRLDRYVTGSDAVGLTMGYYDSRALPIWRYLHGRGAPNYVIADRFFQAAFGGSFLNHQYLVAARPPEYLKAPAGLHSVLDADGFPSRYPSYRPSGRNAGRVFNGASDGVPDGVLDGPLTQACGPTADKKVACGDYAVNTIQPASPPYDDGPRLPSLSAPAIGDRLTAARVPWGWYSGGWKQAAAGNPGSLFQYHHQPLNYFAAYAPGRPGRAHLEDETEFATAARQGRLPVVSFVKPYGAENEHPGYASVATGSDHLVDLIKTVVDGPQADDTLVVVVYDEHGGFWDHVPPPGAGSRTPGPYDRFGPGSRVPALVLSRSLKRSGVDHTVYDTTSILATIERGLGLRPLSDRDAKVADLGGALRTGGVSK